MFEHATDRRRRLDRNTIRVILSRVHFVAGLGFLLYGEGLGAQHIFADPTLMGGTNIVLAIALWWAKFPPPVTVAAMMLSLLMLLALTWAYVGGGVMTALVYAALGWSAIEGIYLAGLELFRKEGRSQ